MGKPSVNIPDKNLNFPNPKFVTFIKKMWNSEPVSQTEKDIWTASINNPHAPLIVVSNATLPVVTENVDYILHSFLMPDLGNDLGIDVVSASSSSFLNFTNGGPYNINGMVAMHGNVLHFNLDISFFVSSGIIAVLDYKNGTSTAATVIGSETSANDDGYIELYNGIRFRSESPTNTLKLGLLIDKTANTIKFVVTFNSAGNSSNKTFHQRYEFRRY